MKIENIEKFINKLVDNDMKTISSLLLTARNIDDYTISNWLEKNLYWKNEDMILSIRYSDYIEFIICHHLQIDHFDLYRIDILWNNIEKLRANFENMIELKSHYEYLINTFKNDNLNNENEFATVEFVDGVEFIYTF